MFCTTKFNGDCSLKIKKTANRSKMLPVLERGEYLQWMTACRVAMMYASGKNRIKVWRETCCLWNARFSRRYSLPRSQSLRYCRHQWETSVVWKLSGTSKKPSTIRVLSSRLPLDEYSDNVGGLGHLIYWESLLTSTFLDGGRSAIAYCYTELQPPPEMRRCIQCLVVTSHGFRARQGQ